MLPPDFSNPRSLIISNKTAFLIAGFSIAAWAPIIPFIKERFGLDEHTLGFLLLCVGGGAFLSAPMAGFITSRFGCRTPIFVSAFLWAACLISVSLLHNIYLLAVVLVIFGISAVGLEIISNINGTFLEQASGINVMSGLQALYSVGSLTGSIGVTFLLNANFGVVGSVVCVCTIMLLLLILGGRNLIADATLIKNGTPQKQVTSTPMSQVESATLLNKQANQSPESAPQQIAQDPQSTESASQQIAQAPQSTESAPQQIAQAPQITVSEQKSQSKQEPQNALSCQHPTTLTPQDSAAKPRYWANPYVMLVGFMLFIIYLLEGAMLDWSGVFLFDERNIPLEKAGYGFAAFSVSMVIFRFLGDRLVAIFGRRRIIVGGTLIIFVSLNAAVFFKSAELSILCFALAGIGSSNVIPQLVSFSAQIKAVPIHIAVTLVNAIGFTGVLAGPALIGFLAHAITLPYTFLCLAFSILLVTFISLKLIGDKSHV